MPPEPAIDFVHLPPALAGGGLSFVLEASRRATPVVLGALAPLFLEGDRRLYVADGANCFDPYAFSHEARRRGVGEDVLDRVFVTRCFTIHQLAAVTAELMPPLLGENPPAAMAVLGLDHLFLEESLRAAERSRVLARVMADLAGLRGGGARLLVTHEAPPRGQGWWRPMLEFGDVRARAIRRDDGDWKMRIERCPDGTNAADFQHLAPGGDRLLEGLSPGPEG